MEFDDALDLRQHHPMSTLEIVYALVGDIVDLVEETWQEFDILLWETA